MLNNEYTMIHNVNLKHYNTLKLSATAYTMYYPHSIKGLAEILKSNYNKQLVILGNGSNILFSQTYYNNNYTFISLKLLDKIEKINRNTLSVEAGVKLSNFAWFCVEEGLVNMEFLEDIPGSIGGAIIMNAGTYRDTIGSFVKEVTYFDLDEREIKVKEVQNGDFFKRGSFWSKVNCVVLEAKLSSKIGDYRISIEKLLNDKKFRYLKQPRNYPSAGSVFKRPTVDLKDKVVWELLDDLGFRGYRIGDASFSQKHPGIIINHGEAKFEDIMTLITKAKEQVKQEFDIELELEWKII